MDAFRIKNQKRHKIIQKRTEIAMQFLMNFLVGFFVGLLLAGMLALAMIAVAVW